MVFYTKMSSARLLY